METADPHLAIGESEAHDVVDERFCFACALGYGEGLREKLFDEEEVRGSGEGGIKGENGARAAEAIAWEV